MRNGRRDAAERAESWRPEELSGAGSPDAGAADGDGADAGPGDGGADPSEAALEAAREEGYREGLSEGRRQERERLEAELRKALDAAEEAGRRLEEARQERAETAERKITVLALAVARRIVGRELEDDRDAYAGLVRRALNRIPLDEPVTVRLHPEDLSLLSAVTSRDDFGTRVSGGREIRWRADDGVTRGGCVVEAEDRIVDGSVEGCLERAYRMLVDGAERTMERRGDDE